VKIFNKEEKTLKSFEEINLDHTKANLRSVFYYSIFFPVVEFIGAISAALIIWYGGGKVIQQALTIGVLISFLQYAEMFFRPIRDLSEKYNIMQTAMASSERIFKLLDQNVFIPDPERPAVLVDVRGRIEFRDVSFAYIDEQYVLKNLSFSIRQGEKVAFVGATGAGKTSIMNLLCRFYDVQKGEILLDGVNIKDITKENLRRNLLRLLVLKSLLNGFPKNISKTLKSAVLLYHRDSAS
jgi:ATP-binding cassette subfamily B multidrug efflux pump